MSTRATYQIDGQTFYIHYDGYMAGAAVYFAAAVAHPNPRGGLAAQFIRANELAEFTKSHDYHGDTDYRYTMKNGKLVVEKRSTNWDIVFSGSLTDFLNMHTDSLADPYVTYKGVPTPTKAVYADVLERFTDACAALGRGWVGNARSMLSDIDRQLSASGLTPATIIGPDYVKVCQRCVTNLG